MRRIEKLVKKRAQELAQIKANNLLREYRRKSGIYRVPRKDAATQTDELPRHILILPVVHTKQEIEENIKREIKRLT